MFSLKRLEEGAVPSLWPEVMKTAEPLAAVWPKILPIRQALLSPAMPLIPGANIDVMAAGREI